MSDHRNDVREWLEADGLGGFASGTVCGVRTRRYHALLLADSPELGRMVMVNGFDAWVETPNGTLSISTQRYPDGVTWPVGHDFLQDFTTDPWPTWHFRLTDGITIRQELFVPRGAAAVAIRWSVLGNRSGLKLHVRPFLSGRDYHQLHHANDGFRFDSQCENETIRWKPYADLPAIVAESNATFDEAAEWYRNFVYEAEQQRGLDYLEDLGSPGELHWDLQADDAVLLLAAGRSFSELVRSQETDPLGVCSGAAMVERARRTAASPLERSADAYIVRRGQRTTLVAGYPWFTDWGRDTFIAMRGICLRPDRLPLARQILTAWAATVSQGMLPNRFPDHGGQPEYNSVDASLWYVIAVHEYLQEAKRYGQPDLDRDQETMLAAVDAILNGYARGTRFGIGLDDDGLLACGSLGTQLTWMDAKVDDWVVTPRIGKPVEVQALWLNALWIAAQHDPHWLSVLRSGESSFQARFWNSQRGGYLNDVVDVDHVSGTVDESFRPNQIFAVGGLPHQLVHGDAARSIVDAVQHRLLTPLGLRTLDPADPRYCARFQGGVHERDGAYHQGTVWPWLMGAFVEAWVRVRGSPSEAKQEARQQFVQPLLDDHLQTAGLGHLSEVADGDLPHTPGGCPFQAWSLGELLRLINQVLADEPKQAVRSFDVPIGTGDRAWAPGTTA